MKMKDDLIGKNALITGASSGIGKDIAYIMAEKGINLALLASSPLPPKNLKKTKMLQIFPQKLYFPKMLQTQNRYNF